MESHVKLLGHPVHPMLIPFPVGLFVTAVIFDIIHLISGNGTFSEVAFYMIAAGVIGALLAAVFGFLDFLAIPSTTRAKQVGLLHGGGNLLMTILFAISWLLRYGDRSHPGALALLFSFAGVVVIAFTGWLGGELVDRLGVGVDDGANLDAPSSLSGVPASTGALRGRRER